MKIPEQPTWQEYKEEKKYPQLKEDLLVDVAIVGGGLCGIASAYLLSKEGFDVAVLEGKDQLASDTTMYTTAFITNVIDTDLTQLKSLFGDKEAKLVWQSHKAAIDLIAKIVKNEKIDCDYKKVSDYVIADSEEDMESFQEEHQLAKKYGFKSLLHKTAKNLGFNNSGVWEIKDQGKYNPIKFADQLAEIAAENGVRFFCKTEVKDFKEKDGLITVKTEKAKVTAKKIIIATYKPLKLMKTFAKKGMYQSYVFEAEIPKGRIKEGIYEDNQNPYHYFRIDPGSKKDRIIIGGQDHREELPVNQKKHFEALEEYLESLVGKDYKLAKKWTGPILEPTDGLALIGESGKNQFVATGFSGNGMTYSFIAAMIFKDIISKKKNPWIKIYDPKRIPTAKQLAVKAKDYVIENFKSRNS